MRAQQGMHLAAAHALAAESYLVVQQCKVFKSTQSPVRLMFKTARAVTIGSTASEAPGSTSAADDAAASLPCEPLQIIFKAGDDLRQDQFVCQVQ
jgi:phosphatidylinositol kinase/protein kinase (PI-3  family)